VSSGGAATAEATAVEAALAAARAEARRLFRRQRDLLAISGVGLVVVAARGVVAIASAQPEPSPAVAAALVVSLPMFVVLLVRALRLRDRLEHLLRDIQAIEIWRETRSDAAPRVSIHSMPTDAGSARPVVVVRNDTAERILRKDAPERAPAVTAYAGAVIGVTLLAGALTLLASPAPSSTLRWTFAEPSELAALGLRAEGSAGGDWGVEEHTAATGARALANRTGTHGAPPARLLATEIHARDIRASTRCKVSALTSPASCGLVFRYRDDAHHSLARLDFEERRIVLSRISEGVEQVLTTTAVEVLPGVWQELAVEARGDLLRVTCNGRHVLIARDDHPGDAGSVGVWVPASNEAYFDELAIDILPTASRALEALPTFVRSAS
jgi:hypothetical protein